MILDFDSFRGSLVPSGIHSQGPEVHWGPEDHSIHSATEQSIGRRRRRRLEPIFFNSWAMEGGFDLDFKVVECQKFTLELSASTHANTAPHESNSVVDRGPTSP